MKAPHPACAPPRRARPDLKLDINVLRQRDLWASLPVLEEVSRGNVCRGCALWVTKVRVAEPGPVSKRRATLACQPAAPGAPRGAPRSAPSRGAGARSCGAGLSWACLLAGLLALSPSTGHGAAGSVREALSLFPGSSPNALPAARPPSPPPSPARTRPDVGSAPAALAPSTSPRRLCAWGDPRHQAHLEEARAREGFAPRLPTLWHLPRFPFPTPTWPAPAPSRGPRGFLVSPHSPPVCLGYQAVTGMVLVHRGGPRGGRRPPDWPGVGVPARFHDTQSRTLARPSWVSVLG